jgi:hypothetical protein
MTDVILSQWVIATSIGAIGVVICCLVPAVLVAGRIRSIKSVLNGMRADTAKMKEGLVSDLREVLEASNERHIEAAAQHQAQLGQHLASALQQPLESVAQSLRDFSKNQNTEISGALQEQMAAFADKLDKLLGGQVSTAHELQQQTQRTLEGAIGAMQQMTKSIAATTETAGASMVNQLRAGISRTHAETDSNLKDLINKLGAHVANVISTIEQQSSVASRSAVEQQTRISEQAQRSIEALSAEVRKQTQAIEAASQSMRTAGSDVANAVDRIIEGMTGLISGAAQEIMRSGHGFTEIFDKSSELSKDLEKTAASLASSSNDIGVVVTDYRAARETLQGMVDLMRTTAESARKDSTLAADFVERIEAAAQKLASAQVQADDSVIKLKAVLTEAHGAFGSQMLDTVRDFQEHLGKTSPSEPLSEDTQRRHSEFDRMISDWVHASPRPKPAKAAPPPLPGREFARAAAGGKGD